MVIIENNDKIIENENSLDYVKDLLKQRPPSPDIISNLNRIRVKATPAGYMYLRRISTHYELFSIKQNSEAVPLFSSSLAANEYLQVLSDVWEGVTKPCLDELAAVLKSSKGDLFTKNGDFCLPAENGRRIDSFYVRIIHTHLRYIDNYRRYLMTSKITENLPRAEINRKLIEQQKKYIEHLKDMYIAKGHLVKKLYEPILPRLPNPEKKDYDYSKYDPLIQ